MIFKLIHKLSAATLSLKLLSLLVLSTAPLLLYAQVSANNSNESAGKSSNRIFQLSAAQWEMAYQGDDVMTLPTLKRLMQAWLVDTSKMIEVHYPGGEEGEYWVYQLTDWMVALGIPSKHIVVVPGSGVDDIIKITLI